MAPWKNIGSKKFCVSRTLEVNVVHLSSPTWL